MDCVPNDASFVADQGLSVNAQGRAYSNGKSLPYETKVEVGRVILRYMDENGSIVISKVHEAAKVSRGTVRKIHNEMETHGRILRPEEISANKKVQRGAGSLSLSGLDMFVLMQMWKNDPSTSLKTYAQGLNLITGTVVHPTTISRWFRHAFHFSGTMCRSNMVPFDKFRPENYEKALMYMSIISLVNPGSIKFGDEKHLEGKDLYNRKVRKSVLTGEVPAVLTHPDFRERYTIVGFCGIDPRVSPVRYGITVNTNDASSFSSQIIMAINAGWLLRGDVLVLDNAAIHCGGENTDLEEWLWVNFQIFLVFLPARTPEWNPIELVWNILVQRLNVFCLHLARRVVSGSGSLVFATKVVMDNITHEEVRGCYRRCGYIVPKFIRGWFGFA